MPVAQERDDHIVTVREDIGTDGHGFTDRALDREAAAIDLRPDLLDDDAAGEPLGRRLFTRARWPAAILERLATIFGGVTPLDGSHRLLRLRDNLAGVRNRFSRD